MATLRKQDLASRVSTKMGGSTTQGSDALNAVLDAIQEALSKGVRVVLTGFGTFESLDVKERNVRSIRGQQAGKMIKVPAHKRVGFTPGTELSSSIRGNRGGATRR